MTTNHPEKLDAALVRPGRVDRRVEFGLAMKEQIRELFIRMYSGTDVAAFKTYANGVNGSTSNGSANGDVHDKVPNGKPMSAGEKGGPLSTLHLEELAAEFAAQVPDDTYTPAEIQNHLMRFKKEPWAAVEKVDEWMEEMTAEKDKQKESDTEKEDNVDEADE